VIKVMQGSHEPVGRAPDDRAAGIEGVRCSCHTLRHTGAKRFILAGGDVFTLQKLLGHTTLAMVRRHVELADVDVRAQHQRLSPADSLLQRPVPKRAAQASSGGLRRRTDANHEHTGPPR
jgi:integrase-like protein